MKSAKGVLKILGTRGIPASHGGFETFAEHFALHMAREGWDVRVYCQEIGTGAARLDTWNGVNRIVIPTPTSGSLSSIKFDFLAALHARRTPGACLTLGYNTAIFSILLFWSGNYRVMNMDGIEWSRKKWSWPARIWLWANEWFGARLNQVLIADHPEIARHLERHTNSRKIVTIPYGASENPPESLSVLAEDGVDLERARYALVIARPEPENSLLEIVEGWSMKQRGMPLVVLGALRDDNQFHRQVRAAASDEILFLGAIYDKMRISALRGNARVYVHGHQVGGTNPSLVEAMSFGNPVFANDNRFNQWVVGSGGMFFTDSRSFSDLLDRHLEDDDKMAELSQQSIQRFRKEFVLETIHERYHEVMSAENVRTGASVGGK